MEHIAITILLKDGEYQNVLIAPGLIGQLARAIRDNGSEWITLQNGPVQAVGFLVTGKQTGERIIILGANCAIDADGGRADGNV